MPGQHTGDMNSPSSIKVFWHFPLHKWNTWYVIFTESSIISSCQTHYKRPIIHVNSTSGAHASEETHVPWHVYITSKFTKMQVQYCNLDRFWRYKKHFPMTSWRYWRYYRCRRWRHPAVTTLIALYWHLFQMSYEDSMSGDGVVSKNIDTSHVLDEQNFLTSPRLRCLLLVVG